MLLAFLLVEVLFPDPIDIGFLKAIHRRVAFGVPAKKLAILAWRFSVALMLLSIFTFKLIKLLLFLRRFIRLVPLRVAA